MENLKMKTAKVPKEDKYVAGKGNDVLPTPHLKKSDKEQVADFENEGNNPGLQKPAKK